MIYAIGDVHGEADALRAMLEMLPLEPNDLVIFLGDLINRGLDSFECVEIILNFNRCAKIALHGNHEDAMLGYLENSDRMFVEGMNGQSTLNSYENAGHYIVPGNPSSLPESHLRYYSMAESWTRPFHITDEYIFVHAGWNLALPIKQQSVEPMFWGRVTGFEAPQWTQTVVRGHTPMPKVTFSRGKHYIGLDTGCGLGGFLSAIALPSEKTFIVRPKSFNPHWYALMQSQGTWQPKR